MGRPREQGRRSDPMERGAGEEDTVGDGGKSRVPCAQAGAEGRRGARRRAWEGAALRRDAGTQVSS
jgi:hypothetical protein